MESYKEYGINFSVNTNYEESISKMIKDINITYRYIFNPWIRKYLYYNNKILRDILSDYEELVDSGINVATWEFGYQFKDHGYLYHEMSNKLKSYMDDPEWKVFKDEVMSKLMNFMTNSLSRCDVLTFTTNFGPGITKINRKERYDNFISAYPNIVFLNNISESNIIRSTYYVSNFKSKFTIEELVGSFDHRLISESGGRSYKLYHVDKVSNRVFISNSHMYSPIYYGKLNGELCTVYLCTKMHN